MQQSTMKKLKKINGFTRKPHLLQLISYFFFFGNILVYTFIILPMTAMTEQVLLLYKIFVSYKVKKINIKIISAILFYPISFVVIISGYSVAHIDPTDEVVIEERVCHMQGFSLN